MKIYTNDYVKGHSDFKVKCLTFGLYTQVSDSGPLGPLVFGDLGILSKNYFCTTKAGGSNNASAYSRKTENSRSKQTEKTF